MTLCVARNGRPDFDRVQPAGSRGSRDLTDADIAEAEGSMEPTPGNGMLDFDQYGHRCADVSFFPSSKSSRL